MPQAWKKSIKFGPAASALETLATKTNRSGSQQQRRGEMTT